MLVHWGNEVSGSKVDICLASPNDHEFIFLPEKNEVLVSVIAVGSWTLNDQTH